MFYQIFFSFLFIWLYLSVVYLIAIKKDDLSIIDIAYGPGFVVAGIAQMLFSKGVGIHFIVTIVLVSLWAFRLALQIGIRKIGKGEDFRYSKMRKEFGPRWKLVSYFKVFLFQGLLILIIESPLFIASLQMQGSLGVVAMIGIILWIWGFYWETLGDIQKYKFKKAGNKRIIQTGLWKYSRHPNYFGEITMWWALFLIVLEVPFGWLSIISPILITTLLIAFSGIPMLEKKYEDDPEFQQYKKKTSVLIPWFPKKGE
ncbi:MAG: DUF1295 domain-containing protein [Thermotogota bacterium]